MRTGRLFFFKAVLNFVVSPSLQVKKWENFGARSHGHSARSRGHAFLANVGFAIDFSSEPEEVAIKQPLLGTDSTTADAALPGSSTHTSSQKAHLGPSLLQFPRPLHLELRVSLLGCALS